MTEPNWSYRQQGVDCRIIRLNNLFPSGLRNRIELLSAKTLRLGFAERCISDQQTVSLGYPLSAFNENSTLKQACRCSYPRLSGGGSELIKKVPMTERLPRRFNSVERRSSTSARGVTRTSTRCTRHPAWSREPLRNLILFERKIFSFRALVPP